MRLVRGISDSTKSESVVVDLSHQLTLLNMYEVIYLYEYGTLR